MPHVIVKLWPEPEQQKRKLADAITKAVMDNLGYGQDAVSVSFEEVAPADWTAKVYTPDVLNGPSTLYKQPGYKPS